MQVYMGFYFVYLYQGLNKPSREDSQEDSFQSLVFPTSTCLFVLYFKEPDQLNLQLIILMYF